MPKKSNFMRYEELGIKMEDEDTFIKEEPIEDLSAVPKGICDESWKRLHGNASSVCSERENGHTQGAQGIDAPSSKCEEMCFKAEIEDVYVKEEPMEDLSTTLAGPCEEDEERLQLDASSLRMKEEASGDPGSKGTKDESGIDDDDDDETSSTLHTERLEASQNVKKGTNNDKGKETTKNRAHNNKRRTVDDERADEVYMILKESVRKDDSSIYGEHVACKIRNLNPKVQIIAKHQINNILFEAAMDKYDNNFQSHQFGFPASHPYHTSTSSSHHNPIACNSSGSTSYHPYHSDSSNHEYNSGASRSVTPSPSLLDQSGNKSYQQPIITPASHESGNDFQKPYFLQQDEEP